MYQERVALLEDHLKIIDQHIKALLEDALLKDTLKVLTSIPGIGTLAATVLMAETSLFQGLSSGRAISAYAGLCPALNHSGKNTPNGHISKVGNARVRVAMYLASVATLRADSPFRDYYNRLRTQGKPAKVALCAVARKMLCTVLALFQSGKLYDLHFKRSRQIT